MRSINFSNCLELPFEGNVYQNAIAMGDLDNDGNHELVIGNTEGYVFIYKRHVLVQKEECLGMVAAVAIGDVLNCGSNALVVITDDGWCQIYLHLSKNGNQEAETRNSNNFNLESIHVQRIPANTKSLLLGDVDNDGNIELVVGLTDRVVRSYRWINTISGSQLVCLNKWECAKQIGSIALTYDHESLPVLLVSQPGATYMRIKCDPNDCGDEISFDYNQIDDCTMRNESITNEMVGNIRDGADRTNKNTFGLATLDGDILFVRNNQIIWALQVNQPIFSIKKLDITGNGYDDIVACSWEGNTYVVDQHKNIVRFQMEEPVSGFQAGLYNINESNVQAACLVYTTFSDKVCIYSNVRFNSIGIIPFVPNGQHLKTLYSDFVGEDRVVRNRLTRWLLYGKHDLRET